jgi:CRP-like cAMP-binding protein
MLLFTICSI